VISPAFCERSFCPGVEMAQAARPQCNTFVGRLGSGLDFWLKATPISGYQIGCALIGPLRPGYQARTPEMSAIIRLSVCLCPDKGRSPEIRAKAPEKQGNIGISGPDGLDTNG
jgi:hypothetical protein